MRLPEAALGNRGPCSPPAGPAARGDSRGLLPFRAAGRARDPRPPQGRTAQGPALSMGSFQSQFSNCGVFRDRAVPPHVLCRPEVRGVGTGVALGGKASPASGLPKWPLTSAPLTAA